MTPLALSIQQHENAAGRPMDDVEAAAMAGLFPNDASFPTPLSTVILHAMRAAYAAGIAIEREQEQTESRNSLLLTGDIDRTSNALWRK